MLISPKWQTLGMESQHCNYNVVNISLPSQQAEKILKDVRLNCSSPNKVVQLEALKCWGYWIDNQNPEDWKMNNVCYTAIRPLLTKKLQPLHKDVDVCKLKLSLMWKLLKKVQHIMQMEGPQYILEVFLQSCLMWLESMDGVDNEISVLIFQLFLILFKRTDELIKCDKEMFPPLTEDVLASKKVFQRHADKFLDVLAHWRKVKERAVLIVVWKCFLEHCERFCETIPIRIWHEVFKTVGQICSEANDSLKERLAFLHGCATTLDSVLSSSKFIDFGNLLTTPCEALLKKLLDLSIGTREGGEEEGEVFDPDLFAMAREMSQVLSVKSVDVGGCYDLCNSVLDSLSDFDLKSLSWGVWCGLVHCYKTRLLNADREKLTKTEMKFYRKLRGVAVNFDLDREEVEENCALEVERHIQVLEIGCMCRSRRSSEREVEKRGVKDSRKVEPYFEPMDVDPSRPNPPDVSEKMRRIPVAGKFSQVAVYVPKRGTPSPSRKVFTLNLAVVNDVLKAATGLNVKSLLEGLFGIRFLGLKRTEGHELVLSRPRVVTGGQKNKTEVKKPSPKLWYSVTPSQKVKRLERERREKDSKKRVEVGEERIRETKTESQEEIVSTPRTRSKRKAEEEEEKKRKESMECQTRRKRKSFEVLVQEIVKKNKLRKTEKSVRKKSPVTMGKREKVNRAKKELKEKKTKTEKKVTEASEDSKRQKKESPKVEKGKKIGKASKKDGKLENYFKVLRKTKTRSEQKEEENRKKTKTAKKVRSDSEKEECDRKVETGWKQTSLKSLMKPKKEEKAKQGRQPKSKTVEDKEEDGKKGKKKKKEAKKPNEVSSPFKEVLHDHEYAKVVEPEYLPGSKRLVMRRNRKPEVVPNVEESEESVEDEKVDDSIVETTSSEEESSTVVEAEKPTLEPPSKPEEESSPKEMEPSQEVIQKSEEIEEKKTELEDTPENVTPETPQDEEESSKENKTLKRKRILMMDSVKPSKKLKTEEEDTTEEKENMEVIDSDNKPELTVTPTKEGGGILLEKAQPNSKVNSDVSPITSRALRMIALLPETTKGGQVHRDSTSPKTETKAVKCPNVDKSSRASKMLALISENAVKGVEEPLDWNDDSVSEVPTKPKITTPVSIFSSPKTVKKRKSIRFDEAKNETFMYKIGTPPSQIWRQEETPTTT